MLAVWVEEGEVEKCPAIACDLCVATEVGEGGEAAEGATIEDFLGNRNAPLRFRAMVGDDECWGVQQLEKCKYGDAIAIFRRRCGRAALNGLMMKDMGEADPYYKALWVAGFPNAIVSEWNSLHKALLRVPRLDRMPSNSDLEA